MLLGSKICTALMMLVAGNLSFRELMISDTNSVTLLKGNCNQNLHLVFIDLIQSTTSITTQVLL